MSLSSAQTAAFTAAAGQSPGALSTLLALIAGAVVVLWAADMVRRLGTEGLREPEKLAALLLYKVRALIIVLLLIYLLS